MRVLLLLIGSILLLPGVCSLAMLSSMLLSVVHLGWSALADILPALPITLLMLAISWGGLLLIRKALKRPPPKVRE